MRARVQTEHGVYTVDLDEEEVVELDADVRLPQPRPVELSLPLVLAAAARGSTVVAVVDRRPPLVVSNDAGRTWREAGGGLPRGRAVTIASDDPDVVLYGARNRLYLSTDGGTLWRGLAPELPEIEAIAFE
jgi:photosystem II stability/assembly factor-like uncharacterized protein